MNKPKPYIAFEDVKILQQEQRFKAKRDEQLIKKLEYQKELLEHWFANTYPEIGLKARIILSRKSNELQVENKLKFYSNSGRISVISLEDNVDSGTWYNPAWMENYIDSFVENHKKSIIEIIERYEKGI